MSRQRVLRASDGYESLGTYIKECSVQRVFIVCGNSFHYLKIGNYLEEFIRQNNIKADWFSDFSPNPRYEEAAEGVKKFRNAKSEMIIAVGGGSAIDIAKCIKVFAGMDSSQNYLKQSSAASKAKLIAIPTTAGSGSEATHFSVLYFEGKKYSIADKECKPEAVFLDSDTLQTLPDYQRKSTMLDALCHSIEAWWSQSSTEQSRLFSRQALERIVKYRGIYLQNEIDGNRQMMEAAYLAGQAIDIAKTTAGHAMSYQLTSYYGIAHCHAAALCLSVLWPYMLSRNADWIDPRGGEYCKEILSEIAKVWGCNHIWDAVEQYQSWLNSLGLKQPKESRPEIYNRLAKSVNLERMQNHPVRLSEDTIKQLYRQILQ